MPEKRTYAEVARDLEKVLNEVPMVEWHRQVVKDAIDRLKWLDD